MLYNYDTALKANKASWIIGGTVYQSVPLMISPTSFVSSKIDDIKKLGENLFQNLMPINMSIFVDTSSTAIR